MRGASSAATATDITPALAPVWSWPASRHRYGYGDDNDNVRAAESGGGLERLGCGADAVRLDPVEELSGTPELASYDLILVNSSAGKDSQAMLDLVVEQATTAGAAARLVVVHADLGRIEWDGTRDLAETQARHYGLPFEVVRNRNWSDLLERIEARGKWPDMATRYCTSEFKTGQVRRLITALVAWHRAERGLPAGGRGGEPVRVLNCLGLRADESPKRAKMTPFGFDPASSNSKRHVDQWLPIHDWTVEQVWDRIHRSGVPYHRAYDLGMPRLSCALCVFASRSALTVAITHNPALAADYAAAEGRMGHTFRKDFSIAKLVAQVAAGTASPPEAEDWAA